ncbi:5-carboxymethyl-2-hydroxymuconate Delta-isomerase [Fulvivirga lutimaris]|uniref:5-carboxymethyl-2-hydroxymuconate Delta-isomerase n=1 Tax=Fulvivirga lutimaris TaxID=1819566 RepID=UPI0012BC5F30|nr:5-carboxymethyl-2-hydroxymuconate Delta-isomerase [Fulvivirga lutimaris]MTI39718.1 5-carboxymethyl-2-hydroxymuconate Delta-isomerase [Fulvivirga lutimaris]
MPHFIIDCSENVLKMHSADLIMQKVYDTAVATNLFAKGDIKVRINPFKHYNIGDASNFIHVFGNIMEGRTDEKKLKLSRAIVSALKTILPDIPIISMNIRDFEKSGYCNRSMI